MMTVLADLRFANLSPLWVAVAVLSLATVAAAYLTIRRRGSPRLATLLMALRLAAVAAVLLAIIKPVWTRQSQQTQRPLLAVVVDNSRSMSLPSPQSSGGSRYDAARQWVTEATRSGLGERFELAWFDIEGRMLGADWPDEPMAMRTDLVLAMRGVASRLHGRRVSAAVVLSDGQDNVGRESVLTLGDLPCAVHALGFPAPQITHRETDYALERIDAPTRARLHNTTPITVTVRRDGQGDAVATVTLERHGQVVATSEARFTGAAMQQAVSLDFTPDQPGDIVLAARVATAERETSLRNNAALVRMQVDAQPIRVLYIEGVLRSEYTFLAERLGNDPDVDLATFVRAAATTDGGAAAVADELVTPERLRQIDVVLLGDVDAGMLAASTYEHLRAWVEGGGAIMVLGGYRNLGSDGLHTTPLAEVLPVTPAASPGQIEQPFVFTPTDEGLRHPALSLTGQAADDRTQWEAAPMLRGIVVTGPARPAAVVLARHPVADSADPQGRGHVALAVQPFGQGTAALLAADTTWRWSRLARLAGQPDSLYARFWSQWVRFLAGREEVTPASALALTTDAITYEPGQPVRITVRIDPAAFVGPPVPPQLQARTPDGRTIPLQPSPSQTDPGTWTGQLQTDRSGRYEVHASLAAPGAGDEALAQRVFTRITEFQVEGDDLELDRPWPDPSRLRQIAQLTGGSYHDLDDDDALDRLLASLDDQPITITRATQTPLWHSPGLFVVFVLALGIEWFVRRRHQMA